jgi:hypothetical protein
MEKENVRIYDRYNPKTFASNLLKGDMPQTPKPEKVQTTAENKPNTVIPKITFARLESMKELFSIDHMYEGESQGNGSYVLIKMKNDCPKFQKAFINKLNTFKDITAKKENGNIKIEGNVWHDQSDLGNLKKFARWWASLPEKIKLSIPELYGNGKDYTPPII